MYEKKFLSKSIIWDNNSLVEKGQKMYFCIIQYLKLKITFNYILINNLIRLNNKKQRYR